MAKTTDISRVALAGICGRMGAETALAIVEDPGLELVVGLERPGHRSVGRTLDLVAKDGSGRSARVAVADASSADLSRARVLVDFSSAKAAGSYADLCAASGISYVGGVTGLSESEMQRLRSAAEKVAVVYSPNMSAGVNLLARLVEEAARTLREGYDIEIVESHHKGKADAPSGTAAMLARRAASARGDGDSVIQMSRPAGSRKREGGAITIHSVRGGDVAGEHHVYFLGMGETLVLSHRAHSRRAFARGVLAAVEFACRAAPGLYSMDDVLG